MDIQQGDFIRTSTGIVGKVARVVGNEGARFYRVEQFAKMPWGFHPTKGLRFVAHSEVTDVIPMKRKAATAAEATITA